METNTTVNGPIHFNAPWGTPLKLVTIIASGILIGLAVLGLASTQMPIAARIALAVPPPMIIGMTALFAIRGYTLTGDALEVKRMGWKSRVRLDGLTSVAVDPEATRKSVRACGNGGLFSITGWYHNAKLGTYRMFGTDLKRAVVLRFGAKCLVVTPDEPALFVRRVQERLGLERDDRASQERGP